MEIRRITFEGDYPQPHLSIDCRPPFPEVNPIFRACFHAYMQPYELAIEVGKIAEETAVGIMAHTYAEGVVAKSPTPGFENMKAADWRKFFADHPGHFAELRSYCEARGNWDSVQGGDREGDHGVQGVQNT